MKCAEALDWISVYADMPTDDPLRIAIAQHIQECEGCAEQYHIWEVSEQWDEEMTDWSLRAVDWDSTAPIREFRPEEVMERIYSENSWFTPAHQSGNRMNPRMRNLFAGIVTFCLAVFLSGMLAIAVTSVNPEAKQETGIVPTVIAGTSNSSLSNLELNLSEHGAIEPFLLDVVPTEPQYWIALSLLGIAITLISLHKLTRARS